MPAYRNVRLCGKDCMCLYVCPTGATDTENSIIDWAKCLPGCDACVRACPSGAISIVPLEYPHQVQHSKEVIAAQRALGASKVKQEKIATQVAAKAQTPIARQFATALEKSNRLMAEDILRESGYMLPQSGEVRELLAEMLDKSGDDFPRDAAQLLLKKLTVSV